MPQAAISGGTPTVRLIFAGQSLNLVPGGTDNQFPARTRHYSRLNCPYANIAVTGQSWTALLALQTAALSPYIGTADTLIMVMNGGSSDVAGGDTGAQAFADAVAYADAARTLGVDYVLLCTIPPAAIITGDDETARQDYNTLAIADASSDFDDIIDLTGTGLDDNTDPIFYVSDEIHWNHNGTETAAKIAGPLVAGVLP